MYLHAYSMNEIVKEKPLSKGAVCQIVKDWRSNTEGTDIDEIRLFMDEVRKSGINIQDCVRGFRVTNLLKKLGVYDEFDEDMEDETSRLQMQVNNRKIETEVEIEDSDDEVYNDQLELKKNRQSPNLLDLIRSVTQTTDAGSPTLSTNLTKENKISSAKGCQITYFINAIYKNCKYHGIKPTILIEWIIDLFYFYSVLSEPSMKQSINHHNYQKYDTDDSNVKTVPKEELLDDEINNVIPLISKVTYFIEKKKKEIQQLASTKTDINQEISRLNEQREKTEANLFNTIEKEKKAFSYFQWYNTLKQELRDKFNIVIEQEFEAFARAINDFRDYDYNALQIVTEYKDFVSFREQRSFLKTEMDSINQTKQYLLNDIIQLKDQVYSYRQTMKTFYQLQQIGFGLPKLKELNGLITEVSAANSIDPTEAVPRFFKELEKDYDTKLGLESKIKEMQNEY